MKTLTRFVRPVSISLGSVLGVLLIVVSATPLQPRDGIVVNAYGTSDVSPYMRAHLTSLSATPQFSGRFTSELVAESLYPGVESTEALARISRLVVRGRPTAFGLPFWNSADGGFWHPRLVRSAVGSPVSAELYRDVQFRVDEVIASARSADAGVTSVVFTAVGGKAKVTLNQETADIDRTFLPAGTYSFNFPAETDLVLDQEYVLFLDYRMFKGLYGDSYLYDVRLRPANTLYYAFSVADGRIDNLANARNLSSPFRMTLNELRSLLASGVVGAWVADRPLPDGSLHPVRDGHGPAEAEGWDGPAPAPEGAPGDFSREPKR